MFPVASTVRALMPFVPKPACKMPSLTVTEFAPVFHEEVPGMMTVPSPVLVRFPVLLPEMPPVNVNAPVPRVAFSVAPLAPSVTICAAPSAEAPTPE